MGEKVKLSTAERFFQKVNKTPTCWLWKGATKQSGYGSFWVGDIIRLAHQASWLLFRGKIPKGMFVCHTCDVKNCVNPEHLYIGDRLDNARDAVERQGLSAGPNNAMYKHGRSVGRKHY